MENDKKEYPGLSSPRERAKLTARLMRYDVLILTVCFILTSFSALCGETVSQKPSAAVAVPDGLSTAYSAQIFSDIDVNDAKASTRIWTESILKRKGSSGKSETTIFYDLPSVERAVKEKKVDMVALLPEEFLEIRNRISLVPVAASTPAKGFYKEFVLLVRKSSGVITLRELKNKGLIIEKSRNGALPTIWLETLLMKDGYGEPKEFFSSIKQVNKASQAVLPVFFGQVDACIVSRSGLETMIELNPQVGKELLAIAVSPGFVRAILCLRKDFHDQYKELMVESLTLLHTEPQGKQILTLFNMNRLVPFEFSYLDSTEALLREHRSLKIRIANKR